MDAIFSLGQVERIRYLQMLVQSFGSTYICLWSYLPHPSNCLMFYDGYLQDEVATQPRAGALFEEYRKGFYAIVNDRVPGQAFLIKSPCVELNEMDLHIKASVHPQRQFYQEARIKIAVFMGCKSGEIELGWSKVPGINMENEMRNWFPEDFSLKSPLRELSKTVDPSRHSSSSSSLRSLSMDSPDTSSFLFNLPGTSQIHETLQEGPSPLQPLPSTSTFPLQRALHSSQPLLNPTYQLQQTIQSLQPISDTTSPLQEALQSLRPLPNTSSTQQETMQRMALTRESVDATMTRVILAVLGTSPSSSSSTHNLLSLRRTRETAFKKFAPDLDRKSPLRVNSQRQSMLKRAIAYYRSLNIARREHLLGSRPTSTQLHHMISERKRREKLNESFQALRSLLPPETKKDKASVLIRTREYLTSLLDQVAELRQKNQQLESQLSVAKEAAEEISEASSTGRLDVRLSHLPDSTSSDHRIVDLQVTVRGEHSVTNAVVRLLEFLKQVDNINAVSIQASSHIINSTPFIRLVLRLQIEGSEWDESAFQEAVRRILSDLAR
ncbi:hypothetical protein K2173_016115 [Erythroxylum novogranatense]|uniref:BHLH domain-containing protein n=1 Tax=Erythroxylum novogranatense TaxID=1862640 RepID=A0AAV8SFZ5_9ROSI|nr:hypothetical protein K2173_016115 [Erythroxylum novogranatense]